MPPAQRRPARPATADDNFQQVIVRMPREMHQAIKDKAAEEERTLAQTVRRAVRMYLGEAVA